MRTIIAGSRDLTDMSLVNVAVALSRFPITEVVSGAARGIDALAIEWAHGVGIPCKQFPAKWNKPGGGIDFSAGHKRNQQMAEYADALIAAWDGRSSGTKDMISRARAKGLKVFVYRVA